MEFKEFKRVLTQYLNGRAKVPAPIGSPNAGTLVPPSKYPKLKVPPKFPKFPKVPPKFTNLPKFPKVPLHFRFKSSFSISILKFLLNFDFKVPFNFILGSSC
jgi:hypothetical protein